MKFVTQSIEIAAPPEVVRAKFLDFDSLPKYHKDGFFKRIGPKNPGDPIEVGTMFHNVLEIMEVDAPIVENSPNRFQWGGGISGVFTGQHYFLFEPSKTTPGGTTFTQREDFGGAFSFIMGEGFIAKKIGLTERTNRGWAKYNEDLKRWCEESPSSS